MKAWLCCLCLFFMMGLTAGADLRGKVVHVHDGDTVTLLDAQGQKHQVRLATIDAPELGQPYGQASRKHLQNLAHGRQAVVSGVRTDVHGRTLGKLMLRPAQCSPCDFSRDAGLAQLEAGYAWWYREFRQEQSLADQGHYEYAEFDAKSRRIGLWLDDRPVPPWEWRKQNKVLARSEHQAAPLRVRAPVRKLHHAPRARAHRRQRML
jgi:endonuclease YncB( thermonuclease family)